MKPEVSLIPQFKTCQFVLDAAGLILQADPDAADRIGYPHRDICGRAFRDVLVGINAGWADLVPADWANSPEPTFLPWIEGDKAAPTGLCLHHMTRGELVYATLTPSLAPFRELQKSSLMDFPAHPEGMAQMALRLITAESRLENYMHHFPGVFFGQRPDLSFSFIGPGFQEKFGQPSQSLLRSGAAFLGLLFDKDCDFFLQELEKNSKEKKTFNLTYRVKHPIDGTFVYLLDVRTPLFSPTGLLLGYEGVWLDITRQSIAEARLTSSAWKESLATITSGLVHDFSNIMAGIYSLSELYYDTMDPNNSMYAGMGQIKKSSMQAQKLVRRIIDLNRDLAGQRNYHNIETLIKDQMDLVRIVFPKSTKIETTFTEEDLPVYLDDVAFRQMLLNLCINSRDAMNKTGEISISVRHVRPGDVVLEKAHVGTLCVEREGVEIHFSDTGSGIDEKHLTKIFDPFFTTKEATKGSGFGLYNARLFVENNKGRIGVHSVKGQGTTFFIYLPLADFTEMAEAEEPQTPAKTSDHRRPSFLVYAAQDPENFDLVQQLREQEWEVITFDQLTHVKKYLQTAEMLPHIVLALDVGQDASVEPLLDHIHRDYSGMKIVLRELSRPLDQLPSLTRNKVDLLLDESTMDREVVKQLGQLISKL